MSQYIVKRSEIEQMEGLSKTHFLNPEAQRVNKSLGDLTGLTGLGFHLIEVPPGKLSTEFHVHHDEDECTYILSGSATVLIGDEEFAVEAGDFIGYRAGGDAHTMTNIGETPLKCIVVGQRLTHDVADYPHQKKRLYRSPGQPFNLVNVADVTTPEAGRKA